MLEIDGSQKSGSGTILRLSVALASILHESLHIYNIRKKRGQPGLRPQHLESVILASRICNAEVKGAKLGSRELWFKPNEISGGQFCAEIGTAGSIPMLLMTVIPICAFSKHNIILRVVNGGTDVRNSPTINYIKHVFLPTLELMGLKTSLSVKKYGYYPSIGNRNKDHTYRRHPSALKGYTQRKHIQLRDRIPSHSFNHTKSFRPLNRSR